MKIRHSRVLRHSLLLLVFAVSISGIAPSSAASSPLSPAQMSTRIAAIATEPGSIYFTGTGFSPGEPVYVALYDTWGAHVLETRWTVSTPPFYGPNGSLNPATGYYPGGSVFEVFANLCGVDAMIRAYDQQTATWSTWHTIDTTLTRCSG